MLEVIAAIVVLPFSLVFFVIPLLVVIAVIVLGLGSAIGLKLRQWRAKPATADELREVLERWRERENSRQ
jgi:hypothetical protein